MILFSFFLICHLARGSQYLLGLKHLAQAFCFPKTSTAIMCNISDWGYLKGKRRHQLTAVTMSIIVCPYVTYVGLTLLKQLSFKNCNTEPPLNYLAVKTEKPHADYHWRQLGCWLSCEAEFSLWSIPSHPVSHHVCLHWDLKLFGHVNNTFGDCLAKLNGSCCWLLERFA